MPLPAATAFHSFATIAFVIDSAIFSFSRLQPRAITGHFLMPFSAITSFRWLATLSPDFHCRLFIRQAAAFRRYAISCRIDFHYIAYINIVAGGLRRCSLATPPLRRFDSGCHDYAFANTFSH